MKSYFEIKSAKKVRLADIPARVKPIYENEHHYKQILELHREQLGEFQNTLYADRTRSVLVIFQGMDASGKDGAIKHVMSGVNPQGCSVVSFKTPSQQELDHDFLWRSNIVLPANGHIGIFNRSYYEEALVTRVHPELLDAERLPHGTKYDQHFWKNRFTDIVAYEDYLYRQGYEIIKIFLHISKDEQKRRLMERFENPHKTWKISTSDLHERSFWPDYQKAYQECIGNTSSKANPWYIVPADDKLNARLAISQILVQRFSNMDLKYPALSGLDKQKLRKMKALLLKD